MVLPHSLSGIIKWSLAEIIVLVAGVHRKKPGIILNIPAGPKKQVDP